MGHWAEINDENVVLRVIVADDDAEEWLIENLGGRWLRTSYNTRAGNHVNGGIAFRKNFAGIGMIYDEQRDAFIDEKPFPSWILDEETCTWKPPIERPEMRTDGIFKWDEDSENWLFVPILQK